jgi:hypothetical protein
MASTTMTSIVIPFIALATLAAPTAHAQAKSAITSSSPVEAKLVVPDTTLLPGVPFEMWIELRNASSATVGVGLCGELLVSPEGAEPFTISPGGEGRPGFPTLLPESTWNGGAVTYLVMRPNDTKTLTLPILPELEGPIYFADERVSKPGRYRIALRLDYCWPGFAVPQKSLLPPEFLGAVTTNEVLVERITPTGSDAAVWQRMQELTDGHWIATNWSPAIITEILTKHADSSYYPYALLAASFGGVTDAYLNRVVDGIKRSPKSPVIELLHVQALGATLSARPGDAKGYETRLTKVKQSKRPTTRILQFGREDLPKEPCPPQYDCED